MEAIITIVGFLGAGKTTLLKHLVSSYVDNSWRPFLILNDYENAYLDAQQFVDQVESNNVWPLNGSCICCSGINELRDNVNRIPEREKGNHAHRGKWNIGRMRFDGIFRGWS